MGKNLRSFKDDDFLLKSLSAPLSCTFLTFSNKISGIFTYSMILRKKYAKKGLHNHCSGCNIFFSNYDELAYPVDKRKCAMVITKILLYLKDFRLSVSSHVILLQELKFESKTE